MFERSESSTGEPLERQMVSIQNSKWYTGSLIWWAAGSLAAILGFSRLSYGLLLPALRADLGGSYSVYGTLSTLNFVGYLLGTLMLPLLLARTWRRLAINTFASCAMSVTLLVSGLSSTLWQLALFRLLNGFFAAIATVLTMALTLECIPAQERGKASGLIWSGGAVGILLSGLIAPFILATGASLGWRFVWIIMGIAGGVVASGFAFSRQKEALARMMLVSEQTSAIPSQSRFWMMLRPLFQPNRLLFLSLTYCCFGCGYIIYFTFFIALLEQQGVPVLNAGFVWAGIGLAGALSGWLWGWVMDRWPTGFALALPLILGAAASLSALIDNRGWEYAGAALLGLSAFIAPALMVTALLKRAVADEDYAVSFSTLTALFALGQIVGPLVSSFIVEQKGLAVGTASSAVVLGIAAIFACGYAVMQRRLHVSHTHLSQVHTEEVPS